MFREMVYDPLGYILDVEGDEGFITKGPRLLKEFYKEYSNFLETLATKHAEEGYTRKKVICDDGLEGRHSHAVRCMEWAPGAKAPIHGHGGRPCFDIVLVGFIDVIDYAPSRVKDDVYTLKKIREYRVHPGDLVIVNPFVDKSEVHAVMSPEERSKSLHFYPIDHSSLGVYESVSDGHYRRVEHAVSRD